MPCPTNPCCGPYNPYDPCTAPCPLENSPIIFKAVAVANQAVAPVTVYPVTFPFFALPSEDYSADTSSFTAPYTGLYSFQATVTWSSSLPNTMVTLLLQKNGLNTKFSASTMAPIPGFYVTTIQGNLSLQWQSDPLTGQTSADSVAVAIQSSQNVTILGSTPYPTPITYFQGQRVC
jgi:hypothetical protein